MKLLKLLAISFLVLPILLGSGCGEKDDMNNLATATVTTPAIPAPAPARTAPDCDLASPSIIPAPSGVPQLIYFYRDT